MVLIEGLKPRKMEMTSPFNQAIPFLSITSSVCLFPFKRYSTISFWLRNLLKGAFFGFLEVLYPKYT